MSVNKSKNRVELYPLGKNKDLIYNALMQNQDFVDLVLGENPTTKFNEHFYNTLIIDTTQLDAKTYITIDTTVAEMRNKNIKTIEIVIDFFAPLSLIELSTSEMNRYYDSGYFGNRIDVGLDIIKRTVSDMDIGIGNTNLAPSRPVTIIQPTEKFYGKRIRFYSYDF